MAMTPDELQAYLTSTRIRVSPLYTLGMAVAGALDDTPPVTPPVTPLYVSGEAVDITEGPVTGVTTQYAYATDDTNACITSRSISSDPVTGDTITLHGSQASAPIVSRQPAAGGSFVCTTGTATLNSMSDDHNSFCCWFDATGTPNYILGSHSNQEKYIRGTTTTDHTLTDAKLVSPRVNAGRESLATYHDPHPLPNGKIALSYRTGGSGLGNEVFDLQALDGTWSNKQPAYIDGEGTRSAYFNPMCVEPSGGAHPGRIWRTFQFRESVAAADAAGLWAIYSDDEGTTWRAWSNGVALPASAKKSDLTAANVEAIPSATTDPNYSFYYGIQGNCVHPTTGDVYIAMYYGPATAPSGGAYGTPTAGLTIYVWRLNMTTKVVTKVAARTFSGFGTETLEVSRPTPIIKNGKVCVFYSARFNTDPANTGKMYCTTLDETTLALDAHREVFYRHDINNVGSATFVYDRRAYMTNGTVKAFWMFNRNNVAASSQPPVAMTLSFSSSPPAAMTYAEILGGPVTWHYDARFVTDDGSGKASAMIDQGPNGITLAQGTAGARPTINAADLNGNQTVTFDGVDDVFIGTRAASPPGTTPRFIHALVQQVTWTSGDRMWDVNGMLAFQTGASPSIRMNHGTSGASVSAGPTGTWRSVKEQCQNSAADNIFAGATGGTATTAGNTVSGTLFAIGGSTTATVLANMKLASIMLFEGTAPNNQKKWRCDGILRQIWGTAAVV